MKFNNANVILFLFASAKTTHVNGTSLRKSHVKGSDEEKTYGESMDAVRSMKKIGRTPTDSIVHYADAGSAKLRGGNDARTTNHGSGTTSSFAASVVKELDGSSTTDRNVLHHADAGSAKFGKVTDIRSVHHISITLQKSSAGESSSTTEPLRKLSSVTFDNYNNEIGQARFHEIASLTGDSVLIDLSLGRRTVCNNDGSVVVTAGILLLETNDEGDDTFKYVVKIFGDGSSDELNLSLVHTITEEGEGSIFDSDAYVELALSGDGKTLAIANTKAYRGLDHTRGDSTVKIFKLVDNSWSSSVTIVFSDNAGGGGFYFGGLQVSLSDDGLKLLLGLPYVDDNLDGATVPNVGNVQIYDLTSDSPSTPTFDLAAMEELYSNVNTEGAYIGRKVAISGDGSSIVFSAPGDNKVYWFQVGSPSTLETFSGEQEDTDMGSSLAITYDGKIFAYGARNHDDTDNDAPDKGIVTVQKYIDSEDTWQRLGQVLMGERGEGINGDSYYVGDNFGYDIALSEKDAYDSNQASYVIRLLVGSPKNDVTGLGDEYYYHGQGELFQINYKDATINTPWEQVAYDVDGQTSGEKSGTSVAMSANGDTIIIGAPGYGPSSKGGYFKGIVRVYKQTEYSSVPSSVPSDIPSVTSQPSNLPSVSSKPSSIPSLSLVPSETPSISAKPSNMPSVTSKPSNLPSVSLQPSSIPSLSLVPSETPSVSVLPSVVPSVSSEPSSPPSAVVDKEFQLISTFGKFVEDTKKDWCLTAFENAKLHVRPCRSYDSRSKNMQLWKFTSNGELILAGKAEGEFCVKASFRQLTSDTCGDSNDMSFINFGYKDGSITHTKNEKIWKVGFDPESRFERVRLYRDGTLNEVLDKWDIRYSFEMNITTSPSLSAAPSVSVAPSISTAPSVSAAPSVTPLQFYTKGNHACAFYPSEVQCFGYNVYGELGNPNFTTSSSSTPITMTYSNISASPVKVVTGEGSTCILMDDGSVYCYGLNNYRQLGNFKTTNSRTAVRVKLYSTSLTGATDIVGQYYHYCAIYGNDDKIYCWGWNTSNQLGWNGSLGAKMITATFHSTCVVFKNDPEKVHCKGSADWNDKSYEMDQTITKLTSGIHHVCALLADQTAKCFGLNGDGQLGNGSTIPNYNFASHVLENRNTPLSKITDINAGYYSTCLVADGKPMCFGNNVNYQLGIANGGADVRYPRQVGVAFLPEDGAVVVSAHVGAYNGYVVMSDDSVYSWGKNSFGGLGDGSTSAALIIADTNGEPARKVAFDW